MTYMLDTNICIYIIKHKPQSVFEKFKSLVVGDICISAITYYELEKGVRKSARFKANLNRLSLFVDDIEIKNFDRQASSSASVLAAKLEEKGQTIGPFDTLIAGHALSLNLTLVTNNEKEFSRVEGLAVENWV